MKGTQGEIRLVPPGKADISLDHVLDLAQAGLSADFNGVRRLARLIVDSAEGPEAVVAAKRLDEVLRGVVKRPAAPTAMEPKSSSSTLVEEMAWPTEPMFFEQDHADLLDQFIREAKASDILAAQGLAVRSNMLLLGPPGVGKTSIAGHIASRLGRPFRMVRLDGLISSMLGDTAKNIRTVFSQLRGDGFLFLDEIDAIAKFRDDARDVGELKRVVNTLLQSLDAIPSGCVVIAATNHGQLLDPAVWRRFPFQVEIDKPSRALSADLWEHFLQTDDKTAQALAVISGDLAGSDIREIALSARRTAVLDDKPVNIPTVAEAVLRSRTGRLFLPRADLNDKASFYDALDHETALGDRQVALLKKISPQGQWSHNVRQAGKKRMVG